jgi:hypothetical protein
MASMSPYLKDNQQDPATSPKVSHDEIRAALRPEDLTWLEYAAIRTGLAPAAWTASPGLLRIAHVWAVLDKAARLEGQLIDENASPTRRYTWESAMDEAEAYFLSSPPPRRTKNARRFIAAWFRRVTE